MRRRCKDKNHQQYRNYGGKGIKVCERWQNFANFYEDMGERPEGHSVVRIDKNKDFEPGNCEYRLVPLYEKRNGNAKLTTEEVRRIKELLETESSYSISKMGEFNVSRHAIDAIRDGKTWRHVTIEH